MKMYLHLGQDTIVMTQKIVGVFDLDNSTVSKKTRDFLAKAQREGRVITVTNELPKSFIVCAGEERETVYLSQMSPATLLRRARDGFKNPENTH
ncbi:extracellular matrix regulator RemB [Acutalibacter intestini]|uniref:extracellular matrix regulator RemB n=1 Tax=Acutalibacter intestini TaxID=3093659 RepID=UPI002AC95C23|nr:extracellular matrix/biofilm biosynthesis regulator RemA family protein [Acutalibacter sp. M00204]